MSTNYREKEIFTPVLVNSDFIPELPVEIDNMNGSFPKYAGASSIHSREFYAVLSERKFTGAGM